MAPYGACGVSQSRTRSNAQFEAERFWKGFRKKNKPDRKCSRSKKKHARKFFRSKGKYAREVIFRISNLYYEFGISNFHVRAVLPKAQSSQGSDFEGTVEQEQ